MPGEISSAIQIKDLALFKIPSISSSGKRPEEEFHFILFYSEIDRQSGKEQINTTSFSLDFIYGVVKQRVVELNIKQVKRSNPRSSDAQIVEAYVSHISTLRKEDEVNKFLLEDLKLHIDFSKSLIDAEEKGKSYHDIADKIFKDNPICNLGVSLMELLFEKHMNGSLANSDKSGEPVNSKALQSYIKASSNNGAEFIASFLDNGNKNNARLKELLKKTFLSSKLEKVGEKESQERHEVVLSVAMVKDFSKIFSESVVEERNPESETSLEAPPLTTSPIITKGVVMGFSNVKKIYHPSGICEVFVTFVVPEDTITMENRNFSNVKAIYINGTGVGDLDKNPDLKIKVRYNYLEGTLEVFDKPFIVKGKNLIEYDKELNDIQKGLFSKMKIVTFLYKVREKTAEKVVEEKEEASITTKDIDVACAEIFKTFASPLENNPETKKQLDIFLALKMSVDIKYVAKIFKLEQELQKGSYHEIVCNVLNVFHKAESTEKEKRGENYYACINALAIIMQSSEAQQAFINIMRENKNDIGARFLRNPYIRAIFESPVDEWAGINYADEIHKLLVEQIIYAQNIGGHPTMLDGIWLEDSEDSLSDKEKPHGEEKEAGAVHVPNLELDTASRRGSLSITSTPIKNPPLTPEKGKSPTKTVSVVKTPNRSSSLELPPSPQRSPHGISLVRLNLNSELEAATIHT